MERQQPRLNYRRIAPGAAAAMQGLEAYVHESDLEPALLELVKIRASQINGCAFCLDMHTKDARARGETEQRIYALPAWRETPFYTERERAALAWTEAATLIAVDHVPDAVYDEARAQFSDKELVDLTMAVVAINGWNRLAVSFRSVPGTYQPARPGSLIPRPHLDRPAPHGSSRRSPTHRGTLDDTTPAERRRPAVLGRKLP